MKPSPFAPALATAPLLQAAALLLWGFAISQPLVGAALGAVRAIVDGRRFRLELDDRQLTRAVDGTALTMILLLAGLLAAEGLPRGLLSATAWLPAALLPLVLIGDSNAAPLRLRHIVLTLRGSTLPAAQAGIDLGPGLFGTALLAASVLAHASPAFLGGLALVTTAWLWTLAPATRARLPGFVAAAVAAPGLGFAFGQGLHLAHLQVQNWVVDSLGGAGNPDPYRRQTRIGDLGRLKLSDNIVWRLEVASPVAPPASLPLLLRQGVYSRYASGAWLAQRDAFLPQEATAATHEAPPALRLSGATRDGRALIPVPQGDAGIIAPGQVERNPLGVVRIEAAPAHVDIGIRRAPASAAPSGPPPAATDLELPGRHASLAEQLPELAALRGQAPAARVAGLAAWFAANFRYTLFLGTAAGGERGIEDFLLRDRAGHCEYFATASVLLLRTLGIPARYVSGFAVQEYSPLEGAFLIRQRHAHAWAEAWVDGRWIEIDNTPADWLAAEDAAAPFWRPLADLASFAWHRLGEWRRQADRRGILGAALLLAVAALAGLALRHLRRSPRRGTAPPEAAEPTPTAQDFRALEEEFARLGLPRSVAETPRRWLHRVAHEGRSVVAAARLEPAGKLVDQLYAERYGGSAIASQEPASGDG